MTDLQKIKIMTVVEALKGRYQFVSSSGTEPHQQNGLTMDIILNVFKPLKRQPIHICAICAVRDSDYITVVGVQDDVDEMADRFIELHLEVLTAQGYPSIHLSELEKEEA